MSLIMPSGKMSRPMRGRVQDGMPFWFLLCMAFVVAACDRQQLYEKNVPIKKYLWHSEQAAEFEVTIQDTSFLYDIFLNIRHADFYPYRNIWLQMGLTFPDGLHHTRPLEVPLADESGRWLGNGLGDIWDYRVRIQENAYFPQKGLHRFTIQHNMRHDPLPAIMAVGLRIERKQAARPNFE